MTVSQRRSLKPEKKGKKKTAAQRLWSLHWIMTVFYLLLFVGGAYMVDLSREVSYRGSLYDFHKTLGVIVMSFLLARIFVLLRVLQHKYRRRQPKRTKDWWQTFALHLALYFFMLLVPLSGYFASNWAGYDVTIVGTDIALPRLSGENQALADIGESSHFWLSYTFLASIVLHTLAQKKYLRATLRRFYKAANGAMP